MTDFSDRLEKARDRAGEDNTSITEKLEDRYPSVATGRGSVSGYMNGKREPKAGWVAAFCELTDTNPYWLLYGRGPVRKSDTRNADYERGQRLMARQVAAVVLPVLGEWEPSAPAATPDAETAQRVSESDGGEGEGPDDEEVA